jgi:hypothetical protein
LANDSAEKAKVMTEIAKIAIIVVKSLFFMIILPIV